ncbi:MAG: hypothetical protein IPL39_03935 [Opitutaceae bacterium]|nr:hypothetical protein [Opitutaceae bacterium]
MNWSALSRLRVRRFLALVLGGVLAVLAPVAARAAAPTVLAIERINPATPQSTAGTVVFRATFSTPVYNVDPADFVVSDRMGTANGTVLRVDGTGALYSITTRAADGLPFTGGVYRLDLVDNGHGITDYNGVPLVGGYHLGQTAHLLRNATLASWGANHQDQLGYTTTDDRNPTPAAVPATGPLAGKLLVTAAAGYQHTVALAHSGELYAWGLNTSGQLGNGAGGQYQPPVAVTITGTLAGKTVIALAAGYSHSLALSADGRVFAWGSGQYGQLGNGLIGSGTTSNLPVAVTTSGDIDGRALVAIAAGESHCLALSSDGRVYTWGRNHRGQLGNEISGAGTDSPVPVGIPLTGALTGRVVTAIAAGQHHCLALCNDGALVAWGANTFGQLGNADPTNTDRNVPVLVAATGRIVGKPVAIAAGYDHNLVLTDQGTLYAWGNDWDGQLGTGTGSINYPAPVLMTNFAGSPAVAVTTGFNSSFALAADGQAFAWGNNSYGCLGISSDYNAPAPTRIATASQFGPRRTIGLFSGPLAFHALALVAPVATTVQSIGLPPNGTYRGGQDLAFTVTFSSEVFIERFDTPRLRLTVGDQTVQATCIGKTGPATLSFRYRIADNLNDPDGIRLVSLVGPIYGAAFEPAALAFTPPATGGIRVDNTAPFVTGISRFNPAEETTPAGIFVYRVVFNEAVLNVDASDFLITRTPSYGDAQILSVAGHGRTYFVTISNDGIARQLRLDLKASGTGITDLPGNPVAGGATGSTYFMADGAAPVGWGDNRYSQLGHGSGADSFAAVPVDTYSVPAMRSLSVLASGRFLSVAAGSYGGVFAWTSNPAYGLGDGTPVDFGTGTALDGEIVIALAAGRNHCLALTATGKVFAAGDNNRGQLGNGNTTPSQVPVEVDRTGAMAGEHIIALAAGSYHSLALAASGKVYAWGANDVGQLGDGLPDTDPFLDKSRPLLVTNGSISNTSQVIAIAAGAYFNVALTDTGSAHSWGAGYLGTGSGPHGARSPLAIDTSGELAGQGVIAIAAGTSHVVALTGSHRLYVWGRNFQGQLGQPLTTTVVDRPLRIDQVGALSGRNCIAVGAGADQSFALDDTGAVVAWGYNERGQLGVGAAEPISNPTPTLVDTSDTLAGRVILRLGTGCTANHTLALLRGSGFERSDIWRGRYFGLIANNGRAHDDADPDGDGRSNLLEYATCSDPLAASTNTPLYYGADPELPNDFMLSAPIVRDPDLRLSIETSTTLAADSWTELTYLHGNTTENQLEYNFDLGASGSRRFFRLKVRRAEWNPK